MQYMVMYNKRSMHRETLDLSLNLERVNTKSMEYDSKYLVSKWLFVWENN